MVGAKIETWGKFVYMSSVGSLGQAMIFYNFFKVGVSESMSS